ncbi:MAG: hypothetical protein ACK4SZ_11820 [Allosphingosinicella sp.]|uniref:hypothetical protein n=1 Tax=Allosphingosinicella sp. TaxID=2823234 RepID=UPI00394F20C3
MSLGSRDLLLAAGAFALIFVTIVMERVWPHELCGGWHWLTLPVFIGAGLVIMRLVSGFVGRGSGCLLGLAGIALTMLWLDEGGMFCSARAG